MIEYALCVALGWILRGAAQLMYDGLKSRRKQQEVEKDMLKLFKTLDKIKSEDL